MGVEVEDIDMGYEDIIQSIIEGNNMVTEIGYYSVGDIDGFTLAELATVHEFGKGKIPKRPFMRLAFDKGLSDLFKEQQGLIGAMIDGKITKQEVNEIQGDFHKSQIQNGVINRTLGLKDNADSTKRRKGSETPLVDKNRLIAGTDVKVVKG